MTEEYIMLLQNDRAFEAIIEALKAAAELDYTGKRLRFDSGTLDTALKIVLPITYKKTLEKLQADKEFEKVTSIEF